MGLAASQARFLAITSRKSYCEFESMQIAQDKLSITRQLANATEDYQNSLNQTKLVWDYDGSGENLYDLSYGVLMTPSALNNYNPYLITTRTGSVVLNSQLANAAEVISPDGTAVNATEEGFHEFVDALAANGVIPTSTASAIKELEYSTDAGYGGTPLNKNSAITTSLTGLAYQVREESVFEELDNKITFSTTSDAKGAYKLQINGTYADTTTANGLTLSDLLTKDVVYIYTLSQGSQTEDDDEAGVTKFKNSVQEILDEIHNAFSGILGTDSLANTALYSAYTLIQQIYLTNTVTTGSKRSTEATVSNAISNASDYNGYGFGENTKGNKQSSTIAINLSNLVSAYLTYFELAYNGFNSSYSVGATVDSSYYVTDDPYYNYLIEDDDAVDSVTVMQADFYMQLYNNICANGWTQNDNVEDSTYLENALKNGTYFITSLSSDGYFYQGRYNEGDCIIEVTDEDAIAQAEAEFTAIQAQLTYKEEQLDLEMQNLDAEISSLTTEYDSVKNLISKNIEKVFSLFQ